MKKIHAAAIGVLGSLALLSVNTPQTDVNATDSQPYNLNNQNTNIQNYKDVEINTGGAVLRVTSKPTLAINSKPTSTPWIKPTSTPWIKPTSTPWIKPTAKPTAKMTPKPTYEYTTKPTAKPTEYTSKPTAKPNPKSGSSQNSRSIIEALRDLFSGFFGR